MKISIKKLGIFIVAGIIYIVGQYFRGVWFLSTFIPNVCRNSVDDSGVFCNSPYVETLGIPLITAGEILAVVGIILLFANERAWRAWAKFSLVYIPVATVLTLWIFPFKLPPGVEVSLSRGVYDFGVLYAIITLCIVIFGWWKERKNSQ